MSSTHPRSFAPLLGVGRLDLSGLENAARMAEGQRSCVESGTVAPDRQLVFFDESLDQRSDWRCIFQMQMVPAGDSMYLNARNLVDAALHGFARQIRRFRLSEHKQRFCLNAAQHCENLFF